MKKIKFVIALVAFGLVLNVFTLATRWFSLEWLGICCWNLCCLVWLVGYGNLLKYYTESLETEDRLLKQNEELLKAVSAKDEAIRSYKWDIESLKRKIR